MMFPLPLCSLILPPYPSFLFLFTLSPTSSPTSLTPLFTHSSRPIIPRMPAVSPQAIARPASRFRPELVALISICGAGVVGACTFMGFKLTTDQSIRRATRWNPFASKH